MRESAAFFGLTYPGQSSRETRVLEFDNPAAFAANKMVVAKKVLVVAVTVHKSYFANEAGVGQQAQGAVDSSPADGMRLLSGES